MAKVDPRVAMYNALYEADYPAELKALRETAVGKMMPEAAAVAAATTSAGAKATIELSTLSGQIDKQPALKKLMESVGSKMDDPTPVARVIAQKWKQDPNILAKMEADLQANPAAAKALTDRLTARPETAATTLQKYNGKNFNDVAPLEVAAAPVAPPPAAAPAEQRRPAAAPPAAHAAPHSPPPSRPAPADVAAAPANIPPPPPLDTSRMDKDFFTGLATKSDDEIRTALSNPAVVKGIAKGIADESKKLGIGAEFTESYKRRIDNDPTLVANIQRNFQNNPEFIRQLAKTTKEGGEIPSSMREMAKKTMIDVMENPEKLADDGFVKRMSQGLSMKNTGVDIGNMFKGTGFDKMFGGMFAGIGAFFQGLMEKISTLFKEVTGGEWLSRRNSGRNFFQSFNDAMDDTPNRIALEARAKKDMVVHPMIINGTPRWTHDEPVRDDKGNIVKGANNEDLTRVKPNTLEITTTSGSTIQVMPATGVPARRDMQGNYHMMVVTAVDANNRPSEVQSVVLNQAQYDQYKANLQQYGDRNNPPQVTMLEINTVRGGSPSGANVTSVGPDGTLGKTVTVTPRGPAAPQLQDNQPRPTVS